MQKINQFIYLYPIDEYFNQCLDRYDRKDYKTKLNQCIDLRYRQQGFAINYVTFDRLKISDMIIKRRGDNIIHCGMSFKKHTTKLANDDYPYPDQDTILDQLGLVDHLRVAGFHLWDCVERLARRTHETGIDVLVDEDLTEIFRYRMTRPGFKIDTYPSYDVKKDKLQNFEMFMEPRRDVPWLWQGY